MLKAVAVERLIEIAFNEAMAYTIDLQKRIVAEANVAGARSGSVSRHQSNCRF
jgi:hypothetical protein